MIVQLLNMERQVCVTVNMGTCFMVSKYSLSLIPGNILLSFSVLLYKYNCCED